MRFQVSPLPKDKDILQIVNILMGWLQDTNAALYDLPDWNKATYNDSQCGDVNFGYPWGQATPVSPSSVCSYLLCLDFQVHPWSAWSARASGRPPQNVLAPFPV